jgi:hypothetical protein
MPGNAESLCQLVYKRTKSNTLHDATNLNLSAYNCVLR